MCKNEIRKYVPTIIKKDNEELSDKEVKTAIIELLKVLNFQVDKFFAGEKFEINIALSCEQQIKNYFFFGGSRRENSILFKGEIEILKRVGDLICAYRKYYKNRKLSEKSYVI